MISATEFNARVRKAQKEAKVSNVVMGEWLGMHRSTYAGKLKGVVPWTWSEVEELNAIFRREGGIAWRES